MLYLIELFVYIMKSSFNIIRVFKDNHAICLLGYVVFLHILFVKYYAVTFEFSYNGDLFIIDFNWAKYIFSLLESLIILKVTLFNISVAGLSNTIMSILNLLYFIPGVVQQAVTNEPWQYMIHYFCFWVFMELWLIVIKKKSFNLFRKKFEVNISSYFKVVSFFAVLMGVAIMLYNNKSFSISNLQETLLDVYGVRAEAKLAGVHWIIINIEYWVAYFSVLALTYYACKRKWIYTFILLLTLLSLFLIQANRIFFFLSGISFGVGLFRVKVSKMPVFVSLLGIILLIEVYILDVGLLITDVFRRFSIVPNKISTFYYDYFLGHSPDYLRSMYDRFFSLLGLSSSYIHPPIGEIIGDVYFGREVNCNTGLVGGSMFCFGIPSLIVSTFGYILTFRIYEGLIEKINQPVVEFSFAVLLSVLAINTHAFLANFLNTSYFLLLYMSLIPLSCVKHKTT